MKVFIKAYTLPILILLIGLAIYYFVFSESVKRRGMGNNQTIAEASKETEATKEAGSVDSALESNTPDDTNAPTRLASNDVPNMPQNNASLNDADTQTQAPQTLDASAQNSVESSDTQATPNALDSSTSESNPESSGAQNAAQNSAQDSATPNATQSAPSDNATQDAAKDTAPNTTQGATQSVPNATSDAKKEAIYYVIATSANVRAEPSTTSRIIRKLTLGQSAVVTHIQDDWAKLGAGGWISLSLLSAIEPKQKLYTVIPNTLNIREEPLPNARVIGALYKDQRVQVEQVQDDWAKLDSGGWVSRRLIKELK